MKLYGQNLQAMNHSPLALPQYYLENAGLTIQGDVTLQELLYKSPGSNDFTIDFDVLNAAASELNQINFQTDVNLFHLGIKTKVGGFSLFANVRSNIDFVYNKDMIEFLANGNSNSLGATLDFTGSSHSSVRDFGNIDLSGNSGNGHQYVFLFPSGSGFAGKPKTMGSTLSGGNNTAGEYIVWNDNASTDSVDSAGVHYFDLKTGVSYEGYTRYGIVYGLSANTAGTQFFHIIASSGSSPSSEV